MTVAAANDATSAVYPRKNCDLRITGTGTWTVEVQEQYPDASWVSIPGESYTAATARVIEPASARPLRAKCTAYTSGSPVVSLWADAAGAR